MSSVLITGAAKRIGASCARVLHAQGYNVLLHYHHSHEAAIALCAELNALRADSAQIQHADLLIEDDLTQLIDSAQSAWGGISVLVNNASAFYPTPLGTVSTVQWDELMGSNLKAPFFLAQGLQRTLARQHGCIINLIDSHAERGLENHLVYSLAKAALATLTQFLAKEFADSVRVNGVAPGAILWPERDLSPEQKQTVLKSIPLQRLGTPSDIAKAVLFLIENNYITGHILSVDGGRTL